MMRCYILIYNKMCANKNIELAVIIAMAMMMASCVTPRRVNYLQDMIQGSQIELEDRFEARIAPYDELSISVVSPSDPRLSEPFNNNTANKNGYLVDVNGDIDFPYLNKIHVAGLTRLQMQETLTDMLKREGYISDAFVTVRFSNFKIFFLGAEGGRVLTVSNERCTVLEALDMLGQLDPYTRRDHIAVMREVNGKMVVRYLDPRSSDVFNDPFFMLQQNDFIITDSYNAGTVRSEITTTFSFFSAIASVASLIMTFMIYRNRN